MIRQAIEHYQRLLERSHEATREMAESIEAELQRKQIRFGRELVKISLRPHFVSLEEARRMRRACGTLFECFLKVEQMALQDQAVMNRLGFAGEERDLVRIEHGYPGSAMFSRLDCFAAEHSFKFVEFNVDSPAGGAYLDELQRIFFAQPIFQEFQRKFSIQPMNGRDLILETLLACYAKWGGTSSPHIAIVDWEGVATTSEFQILKEHFESRGCRTTICDPRALELAGGRLLISGQPIDILYKRVVVTELLARRSEVGALVEAARSNAVCIVNPFRGKIVNVKALFDILTHERYRRVYSERERQVIRDHIPWTRRVTEEKTYYRGSKIDLPTFIRKNRHSLVLKPNDDYGGKGVVMGWESDEAAWERALEQALAGCYVVQEKVPVPESSFPIWVDGGLQLAPFRYDTDPYLFGGRTAGFLARLSTSALLNVTAGGAFVPAFEIRRARTGRARNRGPRVERKA